MRWEKSGTVGLKMKIKMNKKTPPTTEKKEKKKKKKKKKKKNNPLNEKKKSQEKKWLSASICIPIQRPKFVNPFGEICFCFLLRCKSQKRFGAPKQTHWTSPAIERLSAPLGVKRAIKKDWSDERALFLAVILCSRLSFSWLSLRRETLWFVPFHHLRHVIGRMVVFDSRHVIGRMKMDGNI